MEGAYFRVLDQKQILISETDILSEQSEVLRVHDDCLSEGSSSLSRALAAGLAFPSLYIYFS